MPQRERKYWPFDVLPVERQTEFHAKLVELLKWAYDAGHSPYLNHSETEINIGSSDARNASFVLRSARNQYWEPWLCDCGTNVRLGPLFGYSDSKCVVFNGIEDVATFSIRWLDGLTLQASLNGIQLFDRMNTDTALTLE